MLARRFILVFLAAIAGYAQAPVEATARVEPTKLRPFLTALQPVIENGFGDREITQITEQAAKLTTNATVPLTFPIIYKGIKSDLRVILKKEPGDVVGLRFLAVPLLIEEITVAIQTIDQHQKETAKVPPTNDAPEK